MSSVEALSDCVSKLHPDEYRVARAQTAPAGAAAPYGVQRRTNTGYGAASKQSETDLNLVDHNILEVGVSTQHLKGMLYSLPDQGRNREETGMSSLNLSPIGGKKALVNDARDPTASDS